MDDEATYETIDDEPDDVMSRDEFIEFLGEAFRTAFRKAADCSQAMKIHQLIDEMPERDWTAVLEFVTDTVLPYDDDAKD